MENEVFKTKDFYLSAFLVAQGHKILEADRSDPRKVFFAFSDFEGREDLVRRFLFGQTKVEPQGFITSIKSLKQLIHSG